jgi:threonine dehydrogenase-like Zn-dependent dehydrogenase
MGSAMGRMGRAVVMVGKQFEIREYAVPEPAPGAMLLRQELAGICGTDVHNWEHQRLAGEILLGHENVGIVEALGKGVEADALGQPLRRGDRVVFAPGTPAGAYGFQRADEAPPSVAVSPTSSTSGTRRAACSRPVCQPRRRC